MNNKISQDRAFLILYSFCPWWTVDRHLSQKKKKQEQQEKYCGEEKKYCGEDNIFDRLGRETSSTSKSTLLANTKGQLHFSWNGDSHGIFNTVTNTVLPNIIFWSKHLFYMAGSNEMSLHDWLFWSVPLLSQVFSSPGHRDSPILVVWHLCRR